MDKQEKVKLGCGIASFLLLLPVRALLINDALTYIAGHGIGFGWALLGGWFLGQYAFPLAVLCWLLHMAGVPTPFLHIGMN